MRSANQIATSKGMKALWARRRAANHEKAIERLARDICWAEWPTTPKDTTKAAYWRGVHPEKKAEYIADAKWLVFIAKKLKPLRILMLVDHP